ncbi:uncharacterized protein A4U43_C02F22520 [Asparagus officinalis]|uniref:Fibronectin type III-like domain-containing protein n=2 Tax=Asparagus officinalis TaxID=4686 RepID=A0A5P1FKF1_ASPOF|nr:uncharacterized protein A4U43_C02F22520 [Asparagus officinalis]
MVETFLRPFEMCVKEGDASSVMCSYNKINGVPSCVDTRLMKQTIRNEWNLHGYIVSDCDSLDAIYSYQHWLDFSPEEAVAAATRAGLDLDCGLFGTNYHKDHGVKAVAEGKLAEKDIDNSLRNLYMVLMRVGFFDNIPQYENLGVKDICTPENIELARESARQGIVLLKNERNTLPLASTKGNKKLKVAVVGPHAQATDVMRGNYAGPPCQITSPENGISRHVNVITRLGCDDFRCKSAHNISEAVEAANIADATIIVTGLDPYHIEGEEKDRDNLLLPGYQTHLIEQVAEASNGPVVLVIMSGGGVDISFAQNNPKIGAILWAGYPGQEGGHAIADVVFGRYNPGGRLPLTWYTNKYVNLLPITSMRLRPDTELGYPGRTYKFYDGPEILYPFGFGLSYTGFRYTIKNFLAAATAATIAMSSSHQKCKNVTYRADTFGFAPPKCQSVVVADSPCGETIKIDVQVTNTGTVDGTDVVLVYSKPPVEIDGAPLKQLAKYERVFVPAKSAKIVKFELNACEALGIVDSTAYVVLPAGKHMIQVGDGEKAVGFPVEIKF